MAVHFHPLTVKDIRRETDDCVTIHLEVPGHLKEDFQYKEGQNITIRTNISGEEIRRSYSICCAPYENQLKVAVKKVQGGIFSQYANDILRQGDSLEVLPPTGNFNSKATSAGKKRYLAIAAGSGITPVIAIIKHCLYTQPESEFTLIYGNRDRNSIIFFDELEDLKNKYIQRFNLVNILSREKTEIPLNHGRIDQEKLSSLGAIINYKTFNDIFICGPEQLIFTARDFLITNGIPESDIHFELFTIPGQAQSVKTETTTSKPLTSGPSAEVTIKLDGRSFGFNLSYEGNSVLDAALQQGADLPYACKGGVCCTCKAKLLEGEITMDVNYALEPEEVAEGYILTCQSHPRSKKILIDFDIK